ncbi:PVC-type heme-binding CxxCH protein [Pollutibacter soli]|uniref:PVC-type heme-binding CxxCH protein n=1 Tax=Pollutibacter soli TaxID=3034157 RepID=UPI003013FA1C
MKIFALRLLPLAIIVLFFGCKSSDQSVLQVRKNDHLVLIGNNLGSRMMNYGYFETDVQLRFPDSNLLIRNMCDGGNTPGFRPHSGRMTPWAFPGAETFQTELATNSGSEGHFESEDQWLTRLKADMIIAFFGFSESFSGKEGVANYKAELDSFVGWTQRQKYNGVSAPQLVLVSPIAFEDLSSKFDLPNGKKENENLSLYTEAMREVAAKRNVLFIDAFDASKKWFDDTAEDLTIDGSQLNDAGYVKFSAFLADQAFGKSANTNETNRQLVHDAVQEKNWFWHNDFKIPNGVHVFGRRYNPFGPANYPPELARIREMTSIRDSAIWLALKGQKMDIAASDARIPPLPSVETNYDPAKNGSLTYLSPEEALKKLQLPPGYKAELFASEKEFPDLAKPVQITFDNKGRLWVACMPSYPHYKPGDPKPNDKIIILEDTDGDNRADKETVFADGLHIPVGFEIAPEGVYISQGTNLMLYTDTNGDDKADKKQILLSGFDDHDTHHAHHAYTSDPSGAIYMGEGVFLHTNVETSYGTVRATNGGFYRYNPKRRMLERTAQLSIPNPWGIAFDDWGQNFFAETSGPDVRWMLPGSVKPRYGVATHKSFNLIEEKHKVRPTSGLEFISSRHFPVDVQGDMILNNTIGFLGTKEHEVMDAGTGFATRWRQDLVKSSDMNYRPVDLEFGPDGSLYIADWHNILIGHMQHNARDPLRDHVHGRIYRVTYPSRPLVTPAKIAGASIPELFENLKLPEYRTRYRTRRELRGRNVDEVLKYSKTWTASLEEKDPRYEHHLMEALWVSWGMDKVDQELLKKMLHAQDYRARAAAVRVLRYTGHQVPDQAELMIQAANDDSGRVRLEAIVAASWLPKEKGLAVLNVASKKPLDDWILPAYETALAHLNGTTREEKSDAKQLTSLTGRDAELFQKGKAIYAKEGFCITCHQADGAGLSASFFPPIIRNNWILGDEDRLIKLVLKGLQGPIEVSGKTYPGQVPMTPFEGLMNDEEVAAVLTYVRNSFGNKGSVISPEKVRTVREKVLSKKGFYTVEELEKETEVKK